MTLCLILMWIGLVAGIELARAALPTLADRFQPVVRIWQSAPLLDRAPTDQLLAALGILVGLFMLGMFFGLGKPGQILSFLVFESAKEKQKLRLELGGQGGYLYQTLVASVGPFLCFLLLTKAAASKQRYLLAVGVLVGVAVFAGKLGTLQKIPWLVFLLQLLVVYQSARRLKLGVGRIAVFRCCWSRAPCRRRRGTAGAGPRQLPEWVAYRFFRSTTTWCIRPSTSIRSISRIPRA